MKNYLLKHIKLLIIKQYNYTELTVLEFSRGIGTRGHRDTCPTPPLFFFESIKSALFMMKSALL
jgi:hypothetical protein